MILRAEKKISIKHVVTVAAVWTRDHRPDLSLMVGAIQEGRIKAAEKRNLSSYLESIGLVKHETVTAAGEEVIRTGMAWVPEYGLYKLSVIDDPILGPYPQVIHFMRVKEADCYSRGESQDYLNYRDIEGKEYTSWLDEECRFRVSLQSMWEGVPKATPVGESVAEATIIWDGKNTSLTIRSDDKGIAFKRVIQPYGELNTEQTMLSLAPGFDLRLNRYPVMYSDVKNRPDLLKKMSRTLKGNELESKKLVLFSMVDESDYDITLQDIVLTPYGRDDAINWVSHLLLLDIENESGYPTPPFIERKASDILASPGFREVDLGLTGRWSKHLESLCGQQKGVSAVKDYAPEAIRRIRLAFDLYPEPIAEEVLQ